MPGMTGVYTATLDAPALPSFQPRLHMCEADRLGWLRIDDDLPRFADNTLTHPDKR